MTTSLIGSYTDQQAEQIALQGLLEALCTNALDCANSLMELNFTWQKTADDVNATDATVEFVLAWLPRRAKLISAEFVSNDSTGLVASNSAYATLSIFGRPGLTGVTSTVTLGTCLTTLAANGGTGNWAEWTPVGLTSLTPFDNTNNVAAGGSLTASIAKTGAGVVVPKGTLTVRVQYV